MVLDRFVMRIRGMVSIAPAAALAIRPFSRGVLFLVTTTPSTLKAFEVLKIEPIF